MTLPTMPIDRTVHAVGGLGGSESAFVRDDVSEVAIAFAVYAGWPLATSKWRAARIPSGQEHMCPRSLAPYGVDPVAAGESVEIPGHSCLALESFAQWHNGCQCIEWPPAYMQAKQRQGCRMSK